MRTIPHYRVSGGIPGVLGIGVCAIALTMLISCAVGTGDDRIQPIAYNHKVHIENAGLECTDCHVHVRDMASATIPSIEICGGCHQSEPMTESPEEKVLLEYVSEGKEIPWRKNYNVPDHVYFSHRRHVVLGELDCGKCHGAVQEMTVPVTSTFLDVTMDNCTGCHREMKVSTDCLSCHR